MSTNDDALDVVEGYLVVAAAKWGKSQPRWGSITRMIFAIYHGWEAAGLGIPALDRAMDQGIRAIDAFAFTEAMAPTILPADFRQ